MPTIVPVGGHCVSGPARWLVGCATGVEPQVSTVRVVVEQFRVAPPVDGDVQLCPGGRSREGSFQEVKEEAFRQVVAIRGHQ